MVKLNLQGVLPYIVNTIVHKIKFNIKINFRYFRV